MLEGCGIMQTVHSPIIHIWHQNWRSIWLIKAIHYLLGEHGVGVGGIHVSDPDWHLIPNNWVHVWTPSWPVHDLNILLVQKGCRVTCCKGQVIVLDITQSYVQTPRCPWQHLIPQDLDVPMPVHGSIHCDQLTPPHPPPPWWIAPQTMTDGPRFPSLGWTQASISLSPCPRRTRTQTSLWYRENRDSSLKIQCLHCQRSHTLCLLPPLMAALAVLQSEPRTSGWTTRPISSGQKLSRNDSNRHPPPKSADHLQLHSQMMSRDEGVCSDHSEQLRVFPWHVGTGCSHKIQICAWTSTLPLMWSASLSVASFNFAYASLRHPQHPGYFSLRIAVSQQPDNSLQYLFWQSLWHDPL